MGIAVLIQTQVFWPNFPALILAVIAARKQSLFRLLALAFGGGAAADLLLGSHLGMLALVYCGLAAVAFQWRESKEKLLIFTIFSQVVFYVWPSIRFP